MPADCFLNGSTTKADCEKALRDYQKYMDEISRIREIELCWEIQIWRRTELRKSEQETSIVFSIARIHKRHLGEKKQQLLLFGRL